jgi:DNA (cytosine-5)-methyltransferase 1
MTGRVYFNEFDPAAAHVLQCLMDDGFLPRGVIDTRSIKEVQPDDLRGFIQCHFFAGFGGWSIAARMAGWPDDRPIWSGSCPCQPFSVAGKGAGIADERHLWPDLHRLIYACRPSGVVGEQVAGKAGYGWFDGVAADLARSGYASRAVDIPACALDAPHIRQRLYWCAVADGLRDGAATGPGYSDRAEEAPVGTNWSSTRPCTSIGDAYACASAVDDGAGKRRGEGRAEHEFRRGRSAAPGADGAGGFSCDPTGIGRAQAFGSAGDSRAPHFEGPANRFERCNIADCAPTPEAGGGILHADANGCRRAGRAEASERGTVFGTAAERDFARRNGSFYADAEWLICHDGKARRAKPGIRLLVDGMPGRINGWRLAGNGLVLPLAAEVVAALMDVLDGRAAA